MLSELREADRAREFLERTVPFFRNWPVSLQRVDVYSVFPRADWVIVYRISVADPKRRRDTERLLVAHHLPDGKFEKAATRIRRQARHVRQRDPLVGELVAEKREDNLLIYPFPLDPKIPSLVEAASPTIARRVLAGHPGCVEGSTGVERCDVEPVRYVPGRRCQLMYTLHLDDGRRLCVFGKILSDDKGRQLYDSMNKVSRLFAGNSDPDLTTPRPLAYIPRWGMVVQEKVPGITLYDMFQLGLANESHVRSAARLIAVLHSGPLELERRHLLADEWHVVRTSYQRLRSFGYDAPAFGRVLEKMQGCADNVLVSALVPVHRDFYDKQILVQGRRTALLDLDALALGFRELDVANFLAHLHLQALEKKTAEGTVSRWQHAFVDAYAGRAERPLNLHLQRFLTAKAFFRLACLCRVRPKSAQLVPELLRYAEDAIQRKDVSCPAARERVQGGVLL